MFTDFAHFQQANDSWQIAYQGNKERFISNFEMQIRIWEKSLTVKVMACSVSEF